MSRNILKKAMAVALLPREQQAKEFIARTAQGHNKKVWAARFEGQYKRVYDVCWGSARAATPNVVVQVKTGGVHQEDQSVYKFLNDVLLLAFERCTSKTKAKFFCCVVLHPGGKNRHYWPLLSRMKGDVVLEVTPSTATDLHGPQPESWIDVTGRTLKPYTKTQLGQVFSGTQKAKYFGLYQRPGTLSIKAKAYVVSVGIPRGSFKIMVWQIGDMQLTKTGRGATVSIGRWLP